MRHGDQFQILTKVHPLSVIWSISCTSPLPRGSWWTIPHQSAIFVNRFQVPQMLTSSRLCLTTRQELPYFLRTPSTTHRRKVWGGFQDKTFQTVGELIRVSEMFNLLVFENKYHKSAKYDRPGECSPEKDCLWWRCLTFRQPERKSSSESNELWIVSRCWKSLVVVLIGPRTRSSRCYWSSTSKAVMLLAAKTVKRDWCVSIRLLLVKRIHNCSCIFCHVQRNKQHQRKIPFSSLIWMVTPKTSNSHDTIPTRIATRSK